MAPQPPPGRNHGAHHRRRRHGHCGRPGRLSVTRAELDNLTALTAVVVGLLILVSIYAAWWYDRELRELREDREDLWAEADEIRAYAAALAAAVGAALGWGDTDPVPDPVPDATVESDPWDLAARMEAALAERKGARGQHRAADRIGAGLSPMTAGSHRSVRGGGEGPREPAPTEGKS